MQTDRQNSTWLAIHYISTLLFSLINLKLNLVYFGETTFGVWIALLSIWGFSNALDLGFGRALIKLVAEEMSNSGALSNVLLSTSFYVIAFSGVIIFALGNTVAELFYYTNLSIIPSGIFEEQQIRLVFIFLGISFYLNYVTIFFRSVFEGLRNFVLTARLGIFYNILIFTGVLLVITLKLSMVHLALFYLAASLLTILLFIVLFIRHNNRISLKPSEFRFAEIKRIIGFSLSIQGATVFGSLIDPLVKYIIGSFLGAGTVSLYEIARRFAAAISGLFSYAFRTFLPKASVLKNKEERTAFLYSEAAQLSALGVVYSGFFFGVSSFFIALLIRFYFGYSEPIIIFLLLALPESINNFGYPVYSFLIGIGKAHYLVIVQLTNVVVVGVSLTIGFYLFENIYGLFGYFLTIIVVNILMLLFASRHSSISILQYIAKCGIQRLLLLDIMITAVIVIISRLDVAFFIPLGALAVFSIIIFLPQFRHYYSYFISPFMKHTKT